MAQAPAPGARRGASGDTRSGYGSGSGSGSGSRSGSGSGGMSADAQCCESVHAIAERQELVLRRQLKELHRLVGAQRQLKGADPLTGQLLEAQAGRAKKPGLLDELPPLLDSAGGIASIGCVAGVVDIMRRATAVDSTRKLLIVVLDKTKDKMPCLAKFVKIQGLGVLSSWLGDASKAGRPQPVLQILRLLPRLPVTVNGLKDSGIGKLVNRLTKEKAGSDEDVRREAAKVVDGWKALAKAKAAADSTAPPPAAPKPQASPPRVAGAPAPAAPAPAAPKPAAEARAPTRGEGKAGSDRADPEKKGSARARATAIRDNDMFGDSKASSGPSKKAKAATRPDHARARAERMKASRPIASNPFDASSASSTERRPSPTHSRPKTPPPGRSSPSAAADGPAAAGTNAHKRTRDPAGGREAAGSPSAGTKKQKTGDAGVKKKRVTWPAADKLANWKFFEKEEQAPTAASQVTPNNRC